MASVRANKNAPTPRLLVDCGVAWLKLCALYPALKPEQMPIIQFNGRLTKTGAWVYVTERVIEVSRKLYQGNEDEYANVLIPHELAHQADFDLYGMPKRGQDHKGTWIEIMQALGLPPDRYHNLKTD